MKSIKNFFKKIVCNTKSLVSKFRKKTSPLTSFLYKHLDDDGMGSVRHSLKVLLVFSAVMTLFQFIVQSLNLLQFGGTIFLNFLPIFLACCFLYFTIGKISWVFSICVTFLSVLLTINHYKIRFRDEPLTSTDFTLGKEAGNIVQGYDLTPDITVFFIVLIFVITIMLSIFKTRNKRPGLKVSIIGTLLTVAVAYLLYSSVYTNTGIYESFYSNVGIYRKTEIVEAKGLVYSLLNDINEMKYEAPEEYSEKKALDIINRYPEPKMPEDAPNVIAVMCEAYTDVQTWENVSFTNENPYEYFNYLKTKGCYGKIFVPGFGGATAVTEFEFLTGDNTSAISSSLPTAYNTIITNNVFSIARIFKDMGYHASAIHPGEPWFYNRQNVYPRMGFDTFASLDDLTGEVEKVSGTYAKDYITADMIINDYNNHLQNNPEKGYFNFTVTIQNHGPYPENTLYYGTEYIPKEAADLTDSEYYIINNYLGGIKDSDTFMKTMYEYINTIDKPTVFIIFGDHLPYLDTEENIYAKLGLEIKDNSYLSYINRHSTDYLIIGNDAYLNNYTPAINGNQETLISSDYLSLKLFDYMNMPKHPFFAFKEEMLSYAPVLSVSHNGSSAGFDEQLPSEFDSLYKELKILQYYYLRDYKNTLISAK